ncbi:MAG: CoA pyrophosphatase [Pseudomonadota bacterium]
MLRSDIERNIGRFQSRRLEDEGLRHAAVSLVILESSQGHGNHSLLLTLRTAKLKQHSGQYALPGGKVDAGETALEAARREVHEELGFELAMDDCLGVLDDYGTRSGFCMTPYVFWAKANTQILPSPDEVEEVYKIPFAELNSEAIPIFEGGVDPDRPVLLSEFPTLGHQMFSPTASIIYQFREVVIRGEDTRVSHFDQPAFAWK